MDHLRSHSKALLFSLRGLFISPHFILLTILGNLTVFIFAGLFYFFEYGTNPLVDEKMDAVWWAFTTVTTVGFGDIVPITFIGRIIGILLMLMGTAFFACYVALISESFLAMELKRSNEIKKRDQKKIFNNDLNNP